MKKLFLTSCLYAFSSIAFQDTDNISSSVVVTQGCYISNVGNIDFGSIDGNFANEKNSNGSVSVVCTLDTTYAIGLGGGLHADGEQRRLADAENKAFINYNLYLDPSYSSPWGEIGSGNEKNGIGNATSQTHTVYASIPSGQQAVSAGVYNDTIVATVNF